MKFSNIDTETDWSGTFRVCVFYFAQQCSATTEGKFDDLQIRIQSQNPYRGTFLVTVLPDQVIPPGMGIAQAYQTCGFYHKKKTLYITSVDGISVTLFAKKIKDNKVERGFFEGTYQLPDYVATLNGDFLNVDA